MRLNKLKSGAFNVDSTLFDLSDILVFVFGAIYIILFGIFYLVSAMNIFKRKTLIYDRLSGLRYVSTIGEKKCDENEKNS